MQSDEVSFVSLNMHKLVQNIVGSVADAFRKQLSSRITIVLAIS